MRLHFDYAGDAVRKLDVYSFFNCTSRNRSKVYLAQTMKTKLTLRLDGTVIENAKRFAASENRAVSSLVEDYFRHVAAPNPPKSTKLSVKGTTKIVAQAGPQISQPLPPSTQSLLGILSVTSNLSEKPKISTFSGSCLNATKPYFAPDTKGAARSSAS